MQGHDSVAVKMVFQGLVRKKEKREIKHWRSFSVAESASSLSRACARCS